MKKFLQAVLLFLPVFCDGQIATGSYFTPVFAAECYRNSFDQFSEDIYSAFERKELQAYKDSNLKIRIHGDSIFEYFRQTYEIVKDEDDPYTTLTITVVDITVRCDIRFPSKNVIEFRGISGIPFYTDALSIKKLTTQSSFYLLSYVANQSTQTRSEYYSDVKAHFIRIQQKLFDFSLTDTILKFEDYSLQDSLSMDLFVERIILSDKTTTIRDSIDIYNQMDRRIITMMDSSNIEGLGLGMAVSSNRGQLDIRYQSIAILYIPRPNQIVLPTLPLFWMSYEDTKKILTPEEINFLNAIFELCIAERLTGFGTSD